VPGGSRAPEPPPKAHAAGASLWPNTYQGEVCEKVLEGAWGGELFPAPRLTSLDTTPGQAPLVTFCG
jgi:hypothetical protein